MPSCKEIAGLIASEELAEARWAKRALVRLHLRMCRHCRRYHAQLRTIGDAARDLLNTEPTETQSLERLESSILYRALGASNKDIEDGHSGDPEPPATQKAKPH